MTEDLNEAVFNFDGEHVKFIGAATHNDGKSKILIFEPLNPEQSSINYFNHRSYFYLPDEFIDSITPTDEFSGEALLMIKMRYL